MKEISLKKIDQIKIIFNKTPQRENTNNAINYVTFEMEAKFQMIVQIMILCNTFCEYYLWELIKFMF